MIRNAVDWFEIPTANLERACAFYEKVFDFKLRHPDTEISPEYGFMAVFGDCEGNRVALHSKG